MTGRSWRQTDAIEDEQEVAVEDEQEDEQEPRLIDSRWRTSSRSRGRSIKEPRSRSTGGDGRIDAGKGDGRIGRIDHRWIAGGGGELGRANPGQTRAGSGGTRPEGARRWRGKRRR
jgi:hypothetical protein